MNLIRLSAEAYQANETVPVFSSFTELPFLSRARKESLRGRTRILMHSGPESLLHEMFVLYGADTFIRANKHLGRDESLFILHGICDVVIFTDDGEIVEVVRLEAGSKEIPKYILLPADIYHSVIIRSPEALLFEATPGPFDKSVTVFADWSPGETDLPRQKLFLDSVDEFKSKNSPKSEKSPENNLVHESKNVFRLQGLRLIGNAVTRFLTDSLISDQLDRIRVCTHENDLSDLQEMFMVFSRETFVTPSFHADKDESLFVVEGLATYVFFDDLGKITYKVPLGAMHNELGRASYCRIPRGVIHALVVESDVVVVKETTSGPFHKSQTFFPEWAPKFPSKDEIFRLNQEYLGTS